MAEPAVAQSCTETEQAKVRRLNTSEDAAAPGRSSYLAERGLHAVPLVGVGGVGDGLGRLLRGHAGVLGGQRVHAPLAARQHICGDTGITPR